ncbi:helix-turn-helix transcriptional regulator [Cohnella zeiphila]|uniref:Helix-turn-helix transcriptional regulator n=1 Tax=Cohnella zeiphila TaxID=2761120 RepID=A0A7X0VY49_9BACL|nr:AraC family transcriptional regulator [Cohnella zeiphila]MBB6734994.1 helix-turn-helix transcriptional regulator [Cohnella zeiphila]
MIELLGCGYRYIHPDGILINRPQGSGDYAFVFFRCRSEVVVRGKRSICERDSYILFGPTTPHSYRESDLPFVNDWFHCVGPGMAELLADLQLPLDTLLPGTDPSLISRSIMELHRIRKSGGPLTQRIVDTEIRSLLMKLSNLREMSLTEKQGRYFRQFSELRDELFNSPQRHCTVELLASRLNLSKSYFQHLYKDLFGCSVVTDIINGRLEYAKYLLQHSAYSVTEVAAMCGYEHDTHFMRQFKKFVGVTPGQYRAHI